ncbi:MAG: GyrI-like domain-containing protein [Actinomycetota bacterium]
MTYEVREKDVPEMLVASVTRTASVATIGKEIQEAFATLMEAIGPVGFGRGMPGTVCLRLGDERSDGTWEIFLPADRPFEPPEGIEVKMQPAMHVAFTTHVGRYDGVGQAHEAIDAWLRREQRPMLGPPRELYLNDPRQAGEDQAITEVQVPIR